MLSTCRADLRGRTATQSLYLQNIPRTTSPSALGRHCKTYLAVASAVDALERSVQRIVLTRPAVEAGERLGFAGRPGAEGGPYLRPLYDALYELMGHDKVQKSV